MTTTLPSIASGLLTPSSRLPVSEWTERNLYLGTSETESKGRMTWHGREYMRDFLDSWNVPYITDLVFCSGSQIGKTTAIMAGTAWVLCEAPSNILWVMPSIGLARSFSTTRWLPLARFSHALAERMPTGTNRRTLWTTLQQALGGSVVNFVGANSPANLASRPARVVVLDEVDKFPRRVRGEADAVNLAEQRTKNFSRPLRVKCSTPTQTDGLIWCEYLKGDQRRFQLPCPFCSKLVTLAWSEQFTILPRLGNEAWIEWDKAARRADGSWDLERVATSAWARCPHCQGQIPDHAKSRMLRAGRWFPTATATAARGFRSYHLSSLYAPGTQTAWGRLAVAFLQAKRSFLGLQGFINGALAEPFERQDIKSERVEIVTEAPPPGEASKLMTVDCQHGSPHFWFAIRAWLRKESTTDTTLIRAGSCDTWQEVEQIQREHGVIDPAVMVDSGWGARSDAEVYRQCAQHSQFNANAARGKHIANGWMPAKGMPSRKTWTAKDGHALPYHWSYRDPFAGTTSAGQAEIVLFEFSGDWFKDLLAVMRDPKRAKEIGVLWSVEKSAASEEYWKHLDAEYIDETPNKRTGTIKRQWVKRSQRWPNHLLDCEVMQVAFAVALGLMPIME